MKKHKTPTFGFKPQPTFSRMPTQAQAAKDAANKASKYRLAPEAYMTPESK